MSIRFPDPQMEKWHITQVWVFDWLLGKTRNGTTIPALVNDSDGVINRSLANHMLRRLQKLGLAEQCGKRQVVYQGVGRKPRNCYRVTQKGRESEGRFRSVWDEIPTVGDIVRSRTKRVTKREGQRAIDRLRAAAGKKDGGE